MEYLDLKLALAALEACDSIAITDASGVYVYVNQNWMRTMSPGSESPLGKHPWDLVPDSRVAEVLKNRRPLVGYQIRAKRQEGLVSYSPLLEDGTLLGVLIWGQFANTEYARRFSQVSSQLARELSSAKERLRTLSAASYNLSGIVGESEAMERLREDIISAARTSSTVLIEGETGVGKELVAQAVHDCSPRRAQRFVRINCSAIPAELAESEFFGYEEGAFTGARRGGRKGKFELASGGSLFLDEINQLPLSMQPKLLRVLQEREIERVGGSTVIPVDARIIAAANVHLRRQVEEGRFRSDLYYRLNVVRLRIPPLRERKEDIPVLARNFLMKLNYQLGTDISSISGEVLRRMMAYHWPGNVRELHNALERAMNRCRGDTLQPEDFEYAPGSAAPRPGTAPAVGGSLTHLKDELEYEALRTAMLQAGGNKTKAARLMGISRNALYKKLKKFEQPGTR